MDCWVWGLIDWAGAAVWVGRTDLALSCLFPRPLGRPLTIAGYNAAKSFVATPSVAWLVLDCRGA
ncbi:MAG: hypothetical protein RL215_2798 [Planctomycetota bacterium]